MPRDGTDRTDGTHRTYGPGEHERASGVESEPAFAAEGCRGLSDAVSSSHLSRRSPWVLFCFRRVVFGDVRAGEFAVRARGPFGRGRRAASISLSKGPRFVTSPRHWTLTYHLPGRSLYG